MLSLENETNHRSGLVALVGKPNVGKSTLMNALVGQKVSIVSNKAQTTRRRVLGILSRPEFQLVFVDTPGVHKPHTRLGKILNEIAQASMVDIDAVCVVVDCHKAPDDEDRGIADMLKAGGWIDPATGRAKKNVILCMNKMDLLKAVDVQSNYDAYSKLFGTENLMMTSFRKGHNMDKLLSLLVDQLPEGPAHFPEDEFTDQPMRVIAAELVREKALRLTKEEVPHAIATVVSEWDENSPTLHIGVDIVVDKDGQKAILIGKQGSMIKKIGAEARKELEELLDKKVYLELFVKVREDWRQNPRMLRDLEYLQ